MSKLNFTVVKSTESSNEGFVNTLETVVKTKVFGVDKSSKLRFLMKTDEQVTVGTSAELDLANYVQVKRESVLDDGTVINSTWLHDKVG